MMPQKLQRILANIVWTTSVILTMVWILRIQELFFISLCIEHVYQAGMHSSKSSVVINLI